MFHKIQELIDDPDALICVLIDEVYTCSAIWVVTYSIIIYSLV